MAMSVPSTVRITSEWIDAPGVVSPELAATWASLSIRFDGETVTHIADERVRSVRDSIEVATYPLARWIVRNWFFLLYHSRPLQLARPQRRFEGRSHRLDRTEWMLHHNLRSVGEGFVWPDLSLVSGYGDGHADWWSDATTRLGAQVRYLTAGTASVGSENYESALRNFIEATIIRLEDQGIVGFPLAEEWQAILDLDAEEREFCAVAARLGLDAFEVSDDVAEVVAKVGTELEMTLLDDFLEAAQPEHLSDDIRWINLAAQAVDSQIVAKEQLPAVEPADPKLPPAQRGLIEAVRVRALLGISPEERVDPFRWLAVAEIENPDESLVGLGGLSSSKAAVLATNGLQRVSSGRRFAAARALREFAASNESHFLVTTSRLPGQQVNRAFAAEFLAPVNGIDAALPGGRDSVSWEIVEEIAQQFEVSPIVVSHQIEDGLGRAVVQTSL